MSGLYITTLTVAVLSLLSAVTVLLLFTRHSHSTAPPTYTSSRLLRIVMMLILSDGCVAVCVLTWHFLQSHESDPARLCRVFLPFPIFFFLAGYGWTIMVAWRFQQVSERIKLYEPPFAMVWAAAFALVLPIVVLNSLRSGGQDDFEVSDTITTSYEGGRELQMFKALITLTQFVRA